MYILLGIILLFLILFIFCSLKIAKDTDNDIDFIEKNN